MRNKYFIFTLTLAFALSSCFDHSETISIGEVRQIMEQSSFGINSHGIRLRTKTSIVSPSEDNYDLALRDDFATISIGDSVYLKGVTTNDVMFYRDGKSEVIGDANSFVDFIAIVEQTENTLFRKFDYLYQDVLFELLKEQNEELITTQTIHNGADIQIKFDSTNLNYMPIYKSIMLDCLTFETQHTIDVDKFSLTFSYFKEPQSFITNFGILNFMSNQAFSYESHDFSLVDIAIASVV